MTLSFKCTFPLQKKQYVFYGKNKVIQNEYFGFKQRKINLSAVKDAASMEINFTRYNMDTTPYLPLDSVNSDFLLFVTGVREAGHPSSKGVRHDG